MRDTFWQRVDIRGEDDCWPWIGGREGSGRYGRTSHQGRSEQAHRIAYMRLRGPIPVGHVVDHTCEFKLCCNPAHHQAVTMGENTRLARERKAA